MTAESVKGRRGLFVGVGLLLTLLVASHVGFWYWPRARPAVPSSGGVTARILTAESHLGYRLWLPYPHQNLAILERRCGSLERTLQSLETLLGMAALELPSFGPFRFPPARDLIVATDRQGHELVMAASVYPMARWLLRAAGAVAGNPWLVGGEVDLAGRRLRVSWRRGVWLAVSEGVELVGSGAETGFEPSLALIRLDQTVGPVPQGLYRLTFLGESPVVLPEGSTGEPAVSSRARIDSREAAAFWASIGPEKDRSPSRAIAILTRPDRAVDELPSVVVLHRGGGQRWRLPGERILGLTGAETYERRVGEWSLFAFDSRSLDEGEAFLPLLRELEESGLAGEVSAGEIWLVRAREAVRGIGETLRRIPVVGPRESRRWLALAQLLDSLEPYDRLSIRMAPSIQLEVRLVPRDFD